MRNSIAIVLLLFTTLFGAALASGQEPVPPTAAIQPNLEQQLAQILENVNRKQRALDILGKRRAEMPAGLASVEVDREIETTQKQLNDLREQFLQLATNDFSFNLNPAMPTPQLDVNWQRDIIQIIHPLLREMKDLTERPRLIEKINGEISYYQEQSDSLSAALTNLQQLEIATKNQNLVRALKALNVKVKERHDDIQQKLSTLHRQLEEQHERPSDFSKSFRAGVRSFVINFCIYLLLAAGISLCVFLVIRLLGRMIGKAILNSYNERLIFVERGVNLLTQFLSIALAALAFLAVLYAVDAWVMFALFLIITLGILLSLRNTLPTYTAEMRTLLNLGSLRQNERLVLNGLPWRIVALDIYTLLHNPSLGAFLRMPLVQISKMSSRPSLPDEPWFPTEVGDFVLLLDGMMGRVAFQTPEIVQINAGEALVHYRTEIFLNQRPQNLSKRGFSVGADFGIDYSHRHEATTTIIDTLRYELEGVITQTEFAPHLIATNVDLKSISASSLDFRISATLKGDAAGMYGQIQRWLQKFAIDCANKHGWNTPFPQMMVHYSKEHKSGEHETDAHDRTIGADDKKDLPPEMVHM